MKCDKHTMLLYAVTDRAWTGRETLRQQVEDALKGGVTCVQLREKELDDAAFLQEAMELSALCRSYGVPFIINDNVDIAIQCHADGIHVGQEDMAAADVRAKVGPDMLLGVSAHSVEEARLAVAHGADYLGVGAAFSTHTKTDVDVLPEGELKKICDAVDVPVVAIGGILVASRGSSAQVMCCDNYLMQSLAAVFVGRSVGGAERPNALGTLIGAMMVSTLENGLTICAVPFYVLPAVKGAVLALALVAAYATKKEQ